MEKQEQGDTQAQLHGSNILLQGKHRSLHKPRVNRRQKSLRECKALLGLMNRFLVPEHRILRYRIYIQCVQLRLEGIQF